MKIEALDNKYIYFNKLFISNNDYELLNYCKEHRLFTIKDFLLYFYKNDLQIKNEKFKLQIEGIVDLLVFKYYGIINKNILEILNSNFDDISFSGKELYTEYLNNNSKIFRRLGLNEKESIAVISYCNKFKNYTIKDILSEYINSLNLIMYYDKFDNYKFLLISECINSISNDLNNFCKKSI